MSRHSADKDAGPMKAVILGCTHYPFVLSSLEHEAKDMVFVDPALATAELCYLDLLEKGILSDRGRMKLSAYISVPAKGLDRKYLDGNGNLTRALLETLSCASRSERCGSCCATDEVFWH